MIYALAAAALFGASTPLAKQFVGAVPPVLLAGLLYLGSGLGLLLVRTVRDRGWRDSGVGQGEWPWLLGAIAFGGMLGPVALMMGLGHTSASAASLLLNLEAVLTAVLAWWVFKENADRQVVLGMVAIVAGGLVLAWPGSTGASGGAAQGLLGPLTIALACLCWAIDNNLTRKVSGADALFVAGSKGLIAGGVNSGLALTLGASLPPATLTAGVMLLGLLGYGTSLVLFVLALRELGTARTGAYFSTAPFMGAFIAIALLGEPSSPALWLAGGLMALGVWLHLTEQHGHTHTHEPLAHTHEHTHDEHHQHEHGAEHGPEGPAHASHSHAHVHAVVTHKHPHFPDIHHRHPH